MERGQTAHKERYKYTNTKFVKHPMNHICGNQVDPGYQIQDSHFADPYILELFQSLGPGLN